MIEILLEAERDLTVGLLDAAEKLYWQAIETDPHNAIAVVGLARVALERGDERTAYTFAVQALTIDPENAIAVRLEVRLAEVLAARGEPVERPAVAIEAARRAEGRARAEMAEAARHAPAPAPPVADYPGDGYGRPGSGDRSPSGPPAESGSPAGSGPPTESGSPAGSGPPAASGHAAGSRPRWRPGLFKRLTRRQRRDGKAGRDGS